MKSTARFCARFCIGLAFLFAFFGFLNAARAEGEAIQNFKADITIQKDGTVLVAENIIYDFGSAQKHGIFREIPLTATNGPRLQISVMQVADEAGQPYQYSSAIENDILRIKIGDPQAFVSGTKTYIITYAVGNSIRSFSDHDEFYWNVTGNQWQVPIRNSGVSVTLPDASISNARMDCFTGPQGSTLKNCTYSQSGYIATYSASQVLGPGEGLTLVLGVPPGFIRNTYSSQQYNPNKSYTVTKFDWMGMLVSGIIATIFGLFGVLIRRIFRRGSGSAQVRPLIPKELKGQPIVVEYGPPDKLLPIDVGTIVDRRVDIADISSVIMDLAVRGYIKIRYTVTQIRFWPDKKDFELIKLKDGSDLVHPADKVIFNLLFSGRDSVTLSDLKRQDTKFQEDITKIKEETDDYLCGLGYFEQTAKKLVLNGKKVATTVILIFGIATVASAIFKISAIAMLLLLPAVAIIFAIVAALKLSHKLTPLGLSAFRKILGFREFLQLVEKGKLELLNAPELKPEMFEKFLPYAMVLGVEEKWAQKFEGIYNVAPDWYEDPTATSFSSYVLAHSLVSFSGSFNQVFSITSPSSGSGFSGGSSGGGSGGGGGGSW